MGVCWKHEWNPIIVDKFWFDVDETIQKKKIG